MATSKRLIRYDPDSIPTYPLECNLYDIPLSALRQKVRHTLSTKLNPPKILLTEEGLPRDWRGVLHCANLHHAEANMIHSHHDQMASVLKLWCQMQNGQIGPNFAQLLAALETIDRFDVADDIKEALEEDAIFYITNIHKRDLEKVKESTRPPPTADMDQNILTRDDVHRANQYLSPQQYDAFVLFADDDIEFASDLITRMEESYGLKLCVRDRDLIAGVLFEHDAIIRLITERCNRLVVICSPAFMSSPFNDFFINYALALGIDTRRRKIIPCIYRACEIPSIIAYCSKLDYQRSISGKLVNFWEKLHDTIRDVPGEIQMRQQLAPPSITITEVDPTTPTSIESNTMVASKQNYSPEINLLSLDTPRRHRDKCITSNSIHDITDSLSDENYNPHSLDASNSDTPRCRIMPPPPPMRPSSSMCNLPSTPSNGYGLMCTNESLCGSTKSVQSSSKRTKWYKGLFSPNSQSNDDLNTTTKKKNKRKWFRKKLATCS